MGKDDTMLFGSGRDCIFGKNDDNARETARSAERLAFLSEQRSTSQYDNKGNREADSRVSSSYAAQAVDKKSGSVRWYHICAAAAQFLFI